MTWKHFSRSEFSCKGANCCNGSNLIDDKLIDLLDNLRDRVGFAMPITSGFRCAAYNARVSTTGPGGPHVQGLAADILVDRDKAVALLGAALQMQFTGIGINQKGGGRFIHLDIVDRPSRTIWSYP